MAGTSSLAAQRSSVQAAAIPGLLAVLRQVFEATMSHDIDAFEPFALRCLGRLVGFDGAVWGSGVVAPGPRCALTISHASVVDRPRTLLSEYAGLSTRDPVTERWLARPEQAIRVGVDATYGSRAHAPVGEYLRRHRIRHLLLLSTGKDGTMAPTRSRSWITAYRECARPFGDADVARLHALLPLWDQARELCLARHLERLARAHPVHRGAMALVDRSGVIHVAEHEFSELTGWARGDCLPPTLSAQPGLPIAPNNIAWRVHDCGSWLLLHAGPPGAAALLSPRERQVAESYGEGLSHKEIARRLGSSPSTVRTQLQTIYRRLGVHSRTELQRALEAS
jgi:DNA-binding CsgD family transcriptional regulator